ncbi:MAG: 30S ribosomal protein S6 [Candidatus Levybacteria bacterium RIFCSPHIGHO2_02_FULL_42_12]|nr:MAG: 30S ribosomal protein S6 [Candidatus Levybacteria bacterium RIFCSPHIGHO2_02_FULL_42_12]
MRAYEFALILKPSLSAAQRKKVMDEIKGALESVTVAKEDDWGEKALAYPIKKQTTGFYSVLTLETEKIVPVGFEKKVFDNEDILRHLLIRTT